MPKSKKLTKKELNQYKNQLLDLREKIGSEVGQIEKDYLRKSSKDSSGDISSHPFHMADAATDAFDTEFNGIRVLSASQTLTLQSGAQPGQTLALVLTAAKTNDLKVSAVKVSSIGAAVSAMSTIDVAIKSVSTLRSTLGAYQNRLEFTINTLAIQEENSQASESAIRDANIATETIAFTRNQILVTAGTAVLAQANLVPQTALTLLG